MPMFSTIIPTYNRESLVAATLESALAQGGPDNEIIVVDDGSTDRTIEVVRGYGPRVRLLQQANSGPGEARNFGAREAAGDYLCFLDSDDLWYPWTLEVYADAIRRFDRPAVVTGQKNVFLQGGDPSAKRAETRFERFDDYLASHDAWRWFSASSFVIRRDVFLATGGYDVKLRVAEDADLMLRLGTAGTFVHVASPPTFAYREHPASLKSDLTQSVIGVSALVERENSGIYPGGPARAPHRREIISRQARPSLIAFARAGHRRDAWRLYNATLGWHLRMRRFKFVLVFPAVALSSAARGKAKS